jgi:hypothetical protein
MGWAHHARAIGLFTVILCLRYPAGSLGSSASARPWVSPSWLTRGAEILWTNDRPGRLSLGALPYGRHLVGFGLGELLVRPLARGQNVDLRRTRAPRREGDGLRPP